MECPRGLNSGTGVDRLEIIFHGEIYVHGQHHQLFMMKDKYDTTKYIDTYMSMHMILCSHKCQKKGNQRAWRMSSCGFFKDYQQLNPVFGTISND